MGAEACAAFYASTRDAVASLSSAVRKRAVMSRGQIPSTLLA